MHNLRQASRQICDGCGNCLTRIRGIFYFASLTGVIKGEIRDPGHPVFAPRVCIRWVSRIYSMGVQDFRLPRPSQRQVFCQRPPKLLPRNPVLRSIEIGGQPDDRHSLIPLGLVHRLQFRHKQKMASIRQGFETYIRRAL
jgi:hypothetical protein